MDPADGTWILTERTHPSVFFWVFGSTLIVAGLILADFWPGIQRYGGWYELGALATGAILCTVVALLAWWAFRPTAFRVSVSGIAIRRTLHSDIEIPREQLVLRYRFAGGFGVVSSPGKQSYILSPGQMEAAKGFFPVSGAKSVGPRQPLR